MPNAIDGLPIPPCEQHITPSSNHSPSTDRTTKLCISALWSVQAAKIGCAIARICRLRMLAKVRSAVPAVDHERWYQPPVCRSKPWHVHESHFSLPPRWLTSSRKARNVVQPARRQASTNCRGRSLRPGMLHSDRRDSGSHKW